MSSTIAHDTNLVQFLGSIILVTSLLVHFLHRGKFTIGGGLSMCQQNSSSFEDTDSRLFCIKFHIHGKETLCKETAIFLDLAPDAMCPNRFELRQHAIP